MKQFVIVGGPTRSGTNTVSLFLHLHEDAVSFGTGAGLHPVNDLAAFYVKLLHCPTAIQTENCIQNNEVLRGLLTEKNNKIRKSMTENDSKKYIVLRWDYGETIFPLMLGLLPKDRQLKMVVALRPVDQVFRSQFHKKLAILDEQENKARELFNKRVSDSFVQLKHLMGKLSDKLLFVDITSQHALAHYQGILSFLDLEPNDLQKDWMEQLPITNATNWEDTKEPNGQSPRFWPDLKDIQYEGDFSDLEAMRQELLTIGGPK